MIIKNTTALKKFAKMQDKEGKLHVTADYISNGAATVPKRDCAVNLESGATDGLLILNDPDGKKNDWINTAIQNATGTYVKTDNLMDVSHKDVGYRLIRQFKDYGAGKDAWVDEAYVRMFSMETCGYCKEKKTLTYGAFVVAIFKVD